MMDAVATIYRPSSVTRDAASGVVQIWTVLQAALICSEQQARGSTKWLYSQKNVEVSTTIYFVEDPGATVNDRIASTSDYTGVTKLYLVQGNSKSDTHGLLWFVDCVDIDAPSQPATVLQPTVAALTTTTVMLGGNVTSAGGSILTAVGVVYSVTATNDYPVLGGTGVTNAAIAVPAVGVFTKAIAGLTADTRYSFRPYVTNGVTTTYGLVTEFVTEAA